MSELDEVYSHLNELRTRVLRVLIVVGVIAVFIMTFHLEPITYNVGTFVFFSMISLSLSQGDPTNSEVFLYTFYQSGIIGGALFQMNRLTSNLNQWEDFSNGYS